MVLRKRTSFKEEMAALVDATDLPDLQKQSIKSRWLDQVILLEGKANWAERNYYCSKIVNIVSSLFLAALVALSVGEIGDERFKGFVRQWSPAGLVGLSLLVTLSATLEGIGGFGESGRQYRHRVENLKSEGWQFLQLAGSYQTASSYQEAYSTFSTRVELIIKRDVEIFTADIFKPSVSERVSAAAAADSYAPFPPDDDSQDPTAGYEEIALAMAEEGLEFPDPETPLPPPLSPSSPVSNGDNQQYESASINRKPVSNTVNSVSGAAPDNLLGAVPPVRVSSPSSSLPAETQVRPDNPDAS